MSQLMLAEAAQRLRKAATRVTTHRVTHPVARPLARPEGLRQPRLLGIRQAAQYLSLSMWTIRHLLKAGELHKVTVPGVARVLVDRLDIDLMVERWKGSSI